MALNSCTPEFVSKLNALVPGLVGQAEPRHLTELRAGATGIYGALTKPRTTDDVSKIVKLCNENNIPVVPWGGGTGLVQGQIYPAGPLPLIISLERMTALRALYPLENTMVCEAGMTVRTAQNHARDAGKLYPLSLASEGTATIGGTTATNAGGLNVLRYGSARDLNLGLEVVFADGSVWHGLRRLRKDNTGYDLRHLIAGSEGTLGIITACSVRLFPIPEREATALIEVENPAAALDLLARAQSMFGNSVSAFELISGQGLEFLAETYPDLPQPFTTIPDWLVLIDIGSGPKTDPADDLATLYDQSALTTQALVSQSESDRQAFWKLREMIPEGNRRIGSVLSNDISLPLSEIPAFLDRATPAIQKIKPFRINAFGHLGDGNLHFNIFPPKGARKEDFAADKDELTRLVNDLVAEHDGSFSAEHGVGRIKVSELERYGDPARLAAMQAIKRALDPKGILNPGAVLRATDDA